MLTLQDIPLLAVADLVHLLGIAAREILEVILAAIEVILSDELLLLKLTQVIQHLAADISQCDL